MIASTGGPQGYAVGDDVEISFAIGSSQSTAPEGASVHVVVTDPVGNDVRFSTGSTGLAKTLPSSDSTEEGWARWSMLIPATRYGRWTYQFTSTGTVRTSMGGAFAVARPLASTST